MKKVKANILFVEDDENLGFILKDYLQTQGYNIQLNRDGVSGLKAFEGGDYDLCILDVMLPEKDGFTLAQEIRALDSEVPIIFLTAKVMKEDRIKGLKLGADDYITKPFSTEELLLRVEAILKRVKYSVSQTDKTTVFTIGLYTFDYTNQKLISPTEERKLTRKEADVLRLLCLKKNTLLRREVVLKNIWGEDDYFMGRSMDVYIAKLRKYLSEDKSITISNVHGTGFKLEIGD